MTIHHYIAIIQFTSSGKQTMGEALLSKINELSTEDSPTGILNLVNVYEKRYETKVELEKERRKINHV